MPPPHHYCVYVDVIVVRKSTYFSDIDLHRMVWKWVSTIHTCYRAERLAEPY